MKDTQSRTGGGAFKTLDKVSIPPAVNITGHHFVPCSGVALISDLFGMIGMTISFITITSVPK